MPALLLAVVMVVGGASTAYLDLAGTATSTELSFWGQEKYQPTDRAIQRTGDTLSMLLQHRSEDPEFLTQHAYYLSWQGFFAENMDQRLTFNEQAVAAQFQALHQRPAYRQGWAEMVEYAGRIRGGAEMLDRAEARIAILQPALD